MGEALIEDAVGRGRGFTLVGREQDLTLLHAVLSRPPAVVFVEGEAGVGKSRLVHEAGAELARSGIRVLTGFCHPLREPLAFGPILEALRSVGPWIPESARLSEQAGALAPLLPQLADHLPPAPPVPDDARTARFQLMGAVRAVLDALGDAVLVVEDMHWADEATRDLLLLLARDLPRQTGLVLTYRGEDLADRTAVLGVPYRRPVGTGGAEIHLEPLSRAEVDALAGSALGSRASPALGRVLFERSGGLPLAVEEDLLTLTEAGHREQLPVSYGYAPASAGSEAALLAVAEIPRGLREAVITRMAALDKNGTELVQAAAVLAVPARRPLLAAVAGVDPDRAGEALVEALAAAVLTETAPALYGFRHVLAQQAVYQAIPGPRRECLHERCLGVLRGQSPAPLVQIAHHTRALGHIAVWLHEAQAAADEAITLGDEGTAAALLRDILDQPRLDTAARSRAALALAHIAELSAEYEASLATLRQILSDPQLPTVVRGEVRLTLGRLMFNQAHGDAGVGELERSVQELEEARPELAARAMVSLATRALTYQRAQQWMRRAERAVRTSPDKVAHATVRANQLALMADHGDPAVWELARQLPRSGEEPGVLQQSARALICLGITATELGHDERSAELIEESMRLARAVGYPALECYARSALLQLDWRGGRWNGLDEHASALAAEFPEMFCAQVNTVEIHACLAMARGQWARALAHLRQSASMLEHHGTDYLPDVLRAAADTARIHLVHGEAQAAYDTIAPPIEQLRHSDTWPRIEDVLGIAVQAALAAGHESTPRQLVAQAQQGLAPADAPSATADLHIACGILHLHDNEHDSASDCFDRARLLFEAIGRPYYAARAIEHSATAHRAAHPLLAADELTRAIEVYTHLGATADAARCQRTQRQLGLTRPKPRGRRSYGTQLSPREAEVARLLADAATNQEIADALALSPRTVEHHVASVLKKLATTRTQLGKSGYREPEG